MTFVESIKTCFKKYATFSGRASRSEFLWWSLFWFVFLLNILAPFLSSIVYGIIELSNASHNLPTNNGYRAILLNISILITLLPLISVSIRRLHDINHSGWWLAVPLCAFFSYSIELWLDNLRINIDIHAQTVFITIITLFVILYLIILLIFFCKKGTNGNNRFGKDSLQ